MKLHTWLPQPLRRWLGGRRHESHVVRMLRKEAHDAKILAARLLITELRQRGPLEQLADAEFRVFSQFGDDGIIQYLIHRVAVKSPTFVEFGVENYVESNTRFLLLNNNWRGCVLDGSAACIDSIREDDVYWRHDLTAVAAFIDRDNINSLLTQHGFAGELGLLSIDIDGNDYWVWEQIDCVSPSIVVVEYNSLFGAVHPVSVPYDPRFVRGLAHYSHLYWGCSLKALCVLADRKGYSFVGCNSHGNNAYFVRNDQLGMLRPLAAEEGYVESRFRESRGRSGRLTFLGGSDRRAAIGDLAVVDVISGSRMKVSQLTSSTDISPARAA